MARGNSGRDEIVVAAEPKRRLITQCEPIRGNVVDRARPVAHQFEALTQAVVIIPEEQCVCLRLEVRAMGDAVFDDVHASGIEAVQSAVVDHVVQVAHTDDRARLRHLR